MPRYLPTLLSALLCVALLAKGVNGIVTISDEPSVTFDGPGEYVFKAPLTSEFTIWHANVASIDGVYTVSEKGLPAGTRIVVEHGGKIVPTTPHAGSQTSGSSGEKVSVLSFTAAETGDYLIKVSGFAEKRSFVINRGIGLGPILAIIGWFLLAGLDLTLCIGLLILALAGKFPRRTKASEPPPLAGQA